MFMILRVLLFLLPIAAWAQPITAPVTPANPAAKIAAAQAEYKRAIATIMDDMARDAGKTHPAAIAAPSQPYAQSAPPVAAASPQPSIVPSDPPSTLLQQIAVAAVPVVGAFIVPLLGWGVFVFQKRTGIKLTDQQKAAVYQAGETAKGIFMARLTTGSAQIADAHSDSVLIQLLASKAIASVPDSAKAQGVTHDQMARIITGAVGRAISADPTIPTTPIPVLGDPKMMATAPPHPYTSPSPPTRDRPPADDHYRSPETDRFVLERIAKTAAELQSISKGQADMAATMNDIQHALATLQPSINALTATIEVDVIPLLRTQAAGQHDPIAAQAVVDLLANNAAAMQKLRDDLAKVVTEAASQAAGPVDLAPYAINHHGVGPIPGTTAAPAVPAG